MLLYCSRSDSILIIVFREVDGKRFLQQLGTTDTCSSSQYPRFFLILKTMMYYKYLYTGLEEKIPTSTLLEQLINGQS